MKKSAAILGLLTSLSFPLFAQTGGGNEVEAVKNVVVKAYCEGIQNLGNVQDIIDGFHPGFILFYVRNNLLEKLTFYNWLETTKKRKKENPNGPAEKASLKFLNVDVTGGTASTKFEVFRGDKLIFTDTFLLLKFDEGWKIIAKVSHRHD